VPRSVLTRCNPLPFPLSWCWCVTLQICNSRFPGATDIILFLTKQDVFEEKVRAVDINSVPEFADYDGPAKDPEAGKEYFLQKLLQQNENKEKKICHHFVNAVDSQDVEVAFRAAMETVLNRKIPQSDGL
jgi:hypothetical protein